jgi:hypothetical protein
VRTGLKVPLHGMCPAENVADESNLLLFLKTRGVQQNSASFIASGFSFMFYCTTIFVVDR